MTAAITPQQARAILEETIREIVPDARLSDLSANADLRESLELDSLDFVELVERLSKRAGFRIEDDDAPALRTTESATAFLVTGSALRS
jgi:acyl carrier protein